VVTLTSAKEREGRGFADRGMGSSGFDDDRQWRREGPLPSHDDRRGGRFDRREGSGFGRNNAGRFDDGDGAERGGFGSKFTPSAGREPLPPSIAEETSDWRSNMRPSAPPLAPERGSRFGSGFANERFSAPGGDGMKRRGPGTPSGAESRSPKLGPADLEEKWTIGSRLKPSVQASPERTGGDGTFSKKFSNERGMEGKTGEAEGEEPGDWRSGPRKVVSGTGPAPGLGRGSSMERTPSKHRFILNTARAKANLDEGFSGPPTRRKLDLLPRSGTGDAYTPIGSPKSGEATPGSATSTKPNPFGDAK